MPWQNLKTTIPVCEAPGADGVDSRTMVSVAEREHVAAAEIRAGLDDCRAALRTAAAFRDYDTVRALLTVIGR